MWPAANYDLRFLDPTNCRNVFVMNNPLLVVEAARWNKVGRRWSIILAVLLSVNLSLVVVAVSGYAVSRSPDQVQVDPSPDLAQTQQAAGNDAGAVTPTTENATANNATVTPTGPVTPVATPAATSGEPVTEGLAPIINIPEYAANGENIVPAPVVIAGDNSSEPIQSNTGKTSDEPTATLVIANPAGTGGVVSFLVDDTVVSLQAGELRRIEGQTQHRVVFHPGDQRDNVELTLETGVFAFSVTTAGWQLGPAGAQAKELLKCAAP
jgi:hypothetical protein